MEKPVNKQMLLLNQIRNKETTLKKVEEEPKLVPKAYENQAVQRLLANRKAIAGGDSDDDDDDSGSDFDPDEDY